MEKPNISDILSRLPNLTYDAKKRKLVEYEAPVEKEQIAKSSESGDVKDTKSLADQVYDRLTELIQLGKEAEEAIDKVCKDIAYTVDQDADPQVYNALSRLFGDDFTGVMTWKMYKQLLELKFMIGDDFSKGELGLNGN